MAFLDTFHSPPLSSISPFWLPVTFNSQGSSIKERHKSPLLPLHSPTQLFRLFLFLVKFLESLMSQFLHIYSHCNLLQNRLFLSRPWELQRLVKFYLLSYMVCTISSFFQISAFLPHHGAVHTAFPPPSLPGCCFSAVLCGSFSTCLLEVCICSVLCLSTFFAVLQSL